MYIGFFIGVRNSEGQSHIGFVDIKNQNKKFEVISFSKTPSLLPGELGTFDDNGVLPSSLIKLGKKLHLFYIGWRPGGTTRYSLIAGHATSKNNGKTFVRSSKAPLLKTNHHEPYEILTAPFVLKFKAFSCGMYLVINGLIEITQLMISNSLFQKIY